VLVDEAQDLSKLEWQIISKIARNTEELVLVGDDDQSIYDWKGSDTRIFQKWPCKEICKRSLPKTHRLPPAVYNVVMNIQSQIQKRLGTKFNCDPNKEGSFRFIDTLKELNGSINSKTDMIMCARTNHLALTFKRYLIDRGIIFKHKSFGSDKGTVFESFFDEQKRKILIQAWDTLKNGGQIKARLYIDMVRKSQPGMVQYGKKGALENGDRQPPELQDPDLYLNLENLQKKYYFKAHKDLDWYEVLKFNTKSSLFTDDEHFNLYLRDCWEQDPTLETNIKIAAIHSIKGMEADIVVLDSNWGPNSIKSYNSGDRRKEDEETRVAYVGTSRAKKHLIIYEHSMKVKNRFPLLTHEFLEQ